MRNIFYVEFSGCSNLTYELGRQEGMMDREEMKNPKIATCIFI